jgi:hypothetical protein
LTESEQKARLRWTGALLPIYASIALAVLAVLVFHEQRSGDQVAAAPVVTQAVEAGRSTVGDQVAAAPVAMPGSSDR